MRQRTQNPPPLKACRFDSDLGHHLNSRVMRSRWALRAELSWIDTSGWRPPHSQLRA
jgi:hypothetical protein